MFFSTIRLFSHRKLITDCKFSRFSSISAAFQVPPMVEQQPISNPNPNNTFFHLDTFGVCEILYDLNKKPDLAISFSHQVKDRGFRHDVNTYYAMVRVLCVSGLERKLGYFFSELIRSKEGDSNFQVLTLFERFSSDGDDGSPSRLVRVVDVLVKVYVDVGMFDEAVNALFAATQCGYSPDECTCNFIINSLIESEKSDMATAVYNQLRVLGFNPNVFTYTILMKSYCGILSNKRNSDSRREICEAAVELYSEMLEAGITPDSYFYTTLIHALCLDGKSSTGYDILQQCREKGCQIDVCGYNVVIHGLCNEKRLQEAEEVLHDMLKYGVSPDEYSYSSIIHRNSKIGNISKAEDLYDEMKLNGVKVNCFIVSSILQGLCRVGMNDKVPNYFQKFKDDGVFLDQFSYNSLIDALCNLGKTEEAEAVIRYMKGMGLVPDLANYTSLIHGYCRQRKPEDAQRIFEKMEEMGVKLNYFVLASGYSNHGFVQEAVRLLGCMEAEGLKPSNAIYCTIIKGLCKEGNVEVAENFVNGLEEKNEATYSAMVNGYCEGNHTGEAYRLFDNLLSKKGIVLSKKSCLKLLQKLCEQGYWDRALVASVKMLDLGMRLKDIDYSVLVFFCRMGNMKKAQALFNRLLKSGITPDVITYTTMMDGYCKGNCLQEVQNLFSDMKRKGVEPDVITYTVLIDALQKFNLRTEDPLHKSERMSKVFDSSALCSEMNDKRIEYDKVLYSVLVDGQNKLSNLQEARILFDEMKNEGLIPDVITYTSLMYGYCNEGDADAVQILLDEMTCKGIEPDDRVKALKTKFKFGK